jgi:cytoskeletal protein CcmA (bactofilin family)
VVRARWWPLAGTNTGAKKPRRSRKRIREVFLGPEIVLSGELKSCDTLVAEGILDSSRIECRKFILGSAGSCKGEVQAESAVISGRFEGRLIVRARLLIKSGGQVRGSVQYGEVQIEPGGELQGDMIVHPASKQVAQDELDILDIPAKPKLGRSAGSSVSSTDKAPFTVPNGTDNQAIEAISHRRELPHQ